MSYPTTNISFQLAAKSSSWWGSGYQASSYLLVLSFIFNKCMRVIPLDNCTNCIGLTLIFISSSDRQCERDHCPVDTKPGWLHEDVWQHQPVYVQVSSNLFRWLHKISWTLVKCFCAGWMFLRKRWSGWRLGASSRGTPRKALTRERFSSKCCQITIL